MDAGHCYIGLRPNGRYTLSGRPPARELVDGSNPPRMDLYLEKGDWGSADVCEQYIAMHCPDAVEKLTEPLTYVESYLPAGWTVGEVNRFEVSNGRQTVGCGHSGD